jgi:hypothetical protein
MIKRFMNTELKFSLLRNSLVQFISWIIFFPGFFSGDSFAAVEMAKTGDLTNSYTASWALYARIFSLFGNSIGLLTLLGGLLLVFSITQFSYSILADKTAAIGSFLLTLTPLVWGMGNTLWHDIQMTSGMLLVTSFMIKIHKSQKITRWELGSQLILGSVLLSFRPNGLPTLLVFAFIYFVFTRKKLVLKYLLIAVTSTVLTTLIASNLILGLSPINNYFAQEWMRNDISCFANTPEGAGFVERNIPGVGNTETWKSQTACTFLNQALLTSTEKVEAQEFVPSAWIALLKQEPLFVIDTHLKRNAYLVPLPLNGLPKPPFLHSTIEFKDEGIEWAFPAVAEKARAPIRLWNLLQSFTAWAGLWGAISFALLIGFKRRDLFVPVLMLFSLIGVLFIFAPIPDGRYALFALIVGQLALLGKLIEWAQTGSNRRPTD